METETIKPTESVEQVGDEIGQDNEENSEENNQEEDQQTIEEILNEEIPEEEMEGWNVKADGFDEEPLPEERFNKGHLLAIEKDAFGNEQYWMNFETYYVPQENRETLPTYDDIIRYPDNYINQYVQFDPLAVSQVLKEEGDYYELVVQLVSGETKPILVAGNKNFGDARILEGDYITFGGHYKGLTDATYNFKSQKVPVINTTFIAPGGHDLKRRVALEDWFNNKIYVIGYKEQFLTCIDAFSEQIQWTIPKQEEYRPTDIYITEAGELLIQGRQLPLNGNGFEMVVSLEGEIISVQK